MLGNHAFSPVGIAAGQCLEQGLMFRIDTGFLIILAGYFDAAEGETMDMKRAAQQDWAEQVHFSGRCQRAVEFTVKFRTKKQVVLGMGLRHPGQKRVHPFPMGAHLGDRDLAGHATFDGEPNAHHFNGFFEAGLSHPGAAIAQSSDQPVIGEAQEGFADRALATSEDSGQFLFQQLLVGDQLPEQNRPFQSGINQFGFPATHARQVCGQTMK